MDDGQVELVGAKVQETSEENEVDSDVHGRRTQGVSHWV